MLEDLVSVIIPVYNSEKFLKESLDSVINQTYKSIEIICIDDGSTDHSNEILQQYCDKVKIISQQNHGLATALNNGLAKSSGKWIKWFSPDDILLPHAIETLVSEIKKIDKPAIVYSNWTIIDEKGKKIRDFSESNYNNLSEYEYNVRLLDGQLINVNTSLISSSLFQQGCIFRNLIDPVAIDYDFFLRAALYYNAKFFLVSKPLIQYRIHSYQLSHRNISKTLTYIESIRTEILNELNPETRNRYNLSLKSFQKNKPATKKMMILGLSTMKFLPTFISDSLLILYLNKLRSSR